MAITPQPSIKSPSLWARLFWHLECWGLKRIDAWGVSYIVSALALFIHDAFSLQTFFLLVAITANYWLGYWLNDYFDAAHDSRDQQKAYHNLFIQRPVVRKYAVHIAGSIFILSAMQFLSFGWQGGIVLLVNFLIMWAYSAPPLRLKSRPGLDLLTHAFFVQTWPYVICMWLIRAAWTQLDGILLVICFLTSLSGQLNQQIRDFEVDSRTDTNFATRVGRATTMLTLRISTSAVFLICVLAIASGNIPWLFVPLGLLAVPRMVHRMLPGMNNSSRINPRYLVYITMLLALLYTGVLVMLRWAV